MCKNILQNVYLEGMPCRSVAFLKAENAVDARLLVAALRHITCIMKLQQTVLLNKQVSLASSHYGVLCMTSYGKGLLKFQV